MVKEGRYLLIQMVCLQSLKCLFSWNVCFQTLWQPKQQVASFLFPQFWTWIQRYTHVLTVITVCDVAMTVLTRSSRSSLKLTPELSSDLGNAPSISPIVKFVIFYILLILRWITGKVVLYNEFFYELSSQQLWQLREEVEENGTGWQQGWWMMNT